MSACHRTTSVAWIGIALVAMHANAADITTGLTLWLDASDAATVLHDANQVTNWVDKVNSANSVFQANPGNCPTYVPAGGPAASGIIRFNGVNVLANSVDVNDTITGEHTVVAVFRPSSLGTMNSPPFASNEAGLLGDMGGYWGLALSGSGASGFVRPYLYPPTGYAETASWLGTNQFSGYWFAAGSGAAAGHIFGGVTNTRPNVADVSIHSAAGTMLIGKTYGGYFGGEIAELRIYDRLLTPVELSDVEAHLTTKWNLPTPSAPPARPPVEGSTLSLDAMNTQSFFLLPNGLVPGWVSETDLSLVFLGGNAPTNMNATAPTGLNTVWFDGVNDQLAPAVISTRLNELITSTNYTVMTVFRAASVDTVKPFSWDCEGLFGESGGYWGLYFNGPNSSPTLRAYHYATGDNNISLPIETNRFYVATWSLTDGTMTLGLYGGASGSLAVGPLASFAFATQLAIGKLYSTGSFFHGDLCELVVYNHALSAGEQAAMQQYLYEKWISGPQSPTGTIITIK